MSVGITRLAPEALADRRSTKRFPAALPVILELGAKKLCARLIDLGAEGGRVEVGVIPMPHSDLLLRCGTIFIRATVIWSRGNEIGLKFQSSLTDEQITEQVRRTQALASLRSSKQA